MREKREPCTPTSTTQRMIAINHLHRRTLERNLKETGIHRAQHRLKLSRSEDYFNAGVLLMNLAANPTSSQMELAKRLEVSPAAVAVSLKSLAKQGLINKTAKQEDARFNSVELTERGRKIVEESREFFNEIERKMYRGFSGEEMTDFCGYLDRIYDNIAQIAEETAKNRR